MTTIVRGKIIDGTGAAPIEDGAIVVRDGRIVSVDTWDRTVVDPGAAVDDRTGQVLIPGIVDAHNHLCLEMGDEEAQMREALPLVFLRCCQRARRDLDSGITTMRSMGELRELDVAYVTARDEGMAAGPRLQFSLDALARTGGHGGYFGLEVDGPVEILRAVRHNLLRGADWIKLMATGGGTTSTSHPTHAGFTAEELQVAVDEAHTMGKPVAVHAHGGIGLRRAVEAGVDTVEHGFYLDDTPEVADAMLERGIALVSTLGLVLPERSEADDPRPVWYQRRLDEMRGHARRSAEIALERGLTIAAGQDGDHGNMALEAACLVEVGMTPLQALSAITLEGARVCRIDDEVGTLTAGKVADIVALGADPLSGDIAAAMRDVRAVWQDGVVVAGGARAQALEPVA
jgi:imidazolonepropionase-like amidohydrolase